MASKKRIRVKSAGAVVALSRGGSKFCGEGETFDIEDVSEVVVRRLENEDPHTSARLEFIEAGSDASSRKTSSSSGNEFDPTDESAKDVLAQLRQASPEEVKRIQKLEKKGKKRATILEFKPSEDAADGGNGGGSDPAGGNPSSDGEPVEGYNGLDEGQVLTLLTANSSDQELVDKIRNYEKDNQGRSAIVDFVSQQEESGNSD